MRLTRAMLIEVNENYRKEMLRLQNELNNAKETIKILEKAYAHPNIALTIALEKTTDVVAHVLTDLRGFKLDKEGR